MSMLTSLVGLVVLRHNCIRHNVKTIEYVARRYCLFAQRRMRAKNATFLEKLRASQGNQRM